MEMGSRNPVSLSDFPGPDEIDLFAGFRTLPKPTACVLTQKLDLCESILSPRSMPSQVAAHSRSSSANPGEAMYVYWTGLLNFLVNLV